MRREPSPARSIAASAVSSSRTAEQSSWTRSATCRRICRRSCCVSSRNMSSNGSAVNLIKVDVRVIAATNRDLLRSATEETFRQDLYYRLNVFPIQLPPLRERREDIPPLVHYFIRRFSMKIGRKITRIQRETMERLVSYSWPGNVRELENVIERAVILSRGVELEVAPGVLPEIEAVAGKPAPASRPVQEQQLSEVPSPQSIEQVERGHILAVLMRTNWRIEGSDGAAALLNLNPSTLRSRMKKLGVQRSTQGVS